MAARSKLNLSRDGVLDTCANTPGKFSGSPGDSLPQVCTPTPEDAENSSQVTERATERGPQVLVKQERRPLETTNPTSYALS